MIRLLTFYICLLFAFTAVGQRSSVKPVGECVIQFSNEASGKKIILNDSTYINSFGEKYNVSKLKYYVSNIHFVTKGKTEPNGIDKNAYLIDAAKENIIKAKMPAGEVTGITFLLGVDSIKNCSGAQSGALDPFNDMFWTWNSGYVMFKLEGKADSSKADLQRIEQHIGGYKGEYKTMRTVFVPINKMSPTINITANLDKYWDGINKISIAETPMTTTVGTNAKKAADNFPGMFSVKD